MQRAQSAKAAQKQRMMTLAIVNQFNGETRHDRRNQTTKTRSAQKSA